jgi:hypothetical protein
MSTPRRVLKGKKFNYKGHTTVIDDAVPVIRWAGKNPLVKRVSVGLIIPSKSTARRVKTKPVPAGLLVTVHGSDALQKLVFYTNDPPALTTEIQNYLRQP